MNPLPKPSITRIVTGLSAMCVLGVTGLGYCLLSKRSASGPLDEAPRPTADSVRVLQPDAAVQLVRSTHPRSASSGKPADERARSAQVTVDAEFRARFLATAATQDGGIERAAQRILADDRPDWEKVVVLRALSDSGSANACDILATTIEDLPDISGSQGDSVPRCALRFLAERAPKDPAARQALLRVAWTSAKPIATGPRASAAASIAALASGDEVWQVVRWLKLERDPLVLAGALEALSRNPDAAAAAAFSSLGVELPVAQPDVAQY